MANAPIQIQRPVSTFENAVVGAALASVNGETDDEIRAIRPPLGMIRLNPPRFGYRVDALGINDIASLDDLYHRYDFTGNQSGYQGTSFPSLNQF